MALHRSVLKEDDILCELYVDTRSDVSDNSDNAILNSDSDIPTTSSCMQFSYIIKIITQIKGATRIKSVSKI